MEWKCYNFPFLQYFAVHGGWGAWTDWGACSLSCGGGVTLRQRKCNNPEPAYGGRPCVGQDSQLDYCNKEHCPGKVLIIERF